MGWNGQSGNFGAGGDFQGYGGPAEQYAPQPVSQPAPQRNAASIARQALAEPSTSQLGQAYGQMQRGMRSRGVMNTGGLFGTGVGEAMTPNAFEKFVGIGKKFDGNKPVERSVSNTFDPTSSPAIGLVLSLVNPALGGLYSAQSALREGNPVSAGLSLASGLAGGLDPFGISPIGNMAKLGNAANSISSTLGGPNADELFSSDGQISQRSASVGNDRDRGERFIVRG